MFGLGGVMGSMMGGGNKKPGLDKVSMASLQSPSQPPMAGGGASGFSPQMDPGIQELIHQLISTRQPGINDPHSPWMPKVGGELPSKIGTPGGGIGMPGGGIPPMGMGNPRGMPAGGGIGRFESNPVKSQGFGMNTPQMGGGGFWDKFKSMSPGLGSIGFSLVNNR